jgi:predicted nuclease of restriction endonuclease-like (RecB) superfamily
MQTLLNDIRHIIAQARERAVRSVNHELTVAYWHIGQRLVEEEQQGKERAEYGKRLVEDLSAHLTAEFGSGFSSQNLWFMRQFYLAFPILSALRRELTWTHYKALVRLDAPDKRTFYIAEAVKKVLERFAEEHPDFE